MQNYMQKAYITCISIIHKGFEIMIKFQKNVGLENEDAGNH